MLMDEETKRELDLMWKHGVEDVRSEIRATRVDLKTEIKELSNNIASARKLVITLIVTAVPTWIAALIAFFALKR